MNVVEQKMNTTTQDKKVSNKILADVISWIKFALVLVAIIFIVRNFIGITIISGNSMAPTIHNKDIIVSNNLIYTPEKNDIILYRDTKGFNVIKRIIAVPNDTVEIVSGVVHVNGEIVHEDFAMGVPNDMAPIVVVEDSYFVMGDNRTPGESLDSRSSDVGLILKERIKGEAYFSLYPFSSLKNK